MNKKIMSLVLASAMVFAIAACSSEEDTAPVVLSGGQESQAAGESAGSDETQVSVSYDSFVFNYNGVDIPMNAPADDIIAALGDGYTYFEAPSCAYEGMDKVYTYGSIVVRSYTRDGVDYIAAVELKDDTVATAEGIRIGASEEEITSAYADDNESGVVSSTGIEYTRGDSYLTFIMEGGRATAITYTAIVA